MVESAEGGVCLADGDDGGNVVRGDHHFVTLYLRNEIFAFPMASVREIIRMPETARLPLSPPSLLGLANLRGVLLPVIDLSRILFGVATKVAEATRVVIVDAGGLVGMVVDRVDRVVTVDHRTIEQVSAQEAGIDANLLSGIVKNMAGHAMIMLLSVDRLLGGEFSAIVRAARSKGLAASHGENYTAQEKGRVDDELQLVSFTVAGQEYAFPIERVEEIIRVPYEITHVPRASSHLLGMITLRQRLLPLVSLRALFAMAPDQLSEQNRVMVISTPEGGVAGVVTDQVNEVMRIAKTQVEQLPKLFAQQERHAEIEAVCQLKNGQRMISVLSVEKMFERESMRQALNLNKEALEAAMRGSERRDNRLEVEIQMVVFRLGHEEYGVAIDVVQEIIRIPEALTHVPNAPAHVEGMVNLRGLLLPVVDLRARLGMDRLARCDQQRIVVFLHRGAKTGFIVDSVSEVTKVAESRIEQTPEVSSDQSHLVERVANLGEKKRMILLLNVARLLEGETTAQ